MQLEVPLVSVQPSVNRWTQPEWAQRYLRDRDDIPHRMEGFGVLLEMLPASPRRVLDLGTGDGLTLGAVREARPGVTGVGVDFSTEMLARARERFDGVAEVEVVDHDRDDPLPLERLGAFDLVVSSFAIHHVVDARKRVLDAEVFEALEPGGCFMNLEHVASVNERLHLEFLAAIGMAPADDDPSNKLAPVETQLGWLRDAGFVDVDCFWKWRELALLAGTKPA
jgi:tRNA (cmo5U34)-methyltransferase